MITGKLWKLLDDAAVARLDDAAKTRELERILAAAERTAGA
jgi:hypothetical protein